MSKTNKETNLKKKPIILFVCNYYLPGYKAGGGLRTIVNTVERFENEFDFRVITLDHDGDGKPYDSIEINNWNSVGAAQVFYLGGNSVKIARLRELISEIKPQAIYINSVFSKLSVFLLTLRRLQLIPNIPVIIAPEGELSDGALQLKASKKKAFIKFAQSVGLYKNLIWKVTAEPEKIESIRFSGNDKQTFIAPNLPSKSIFADYQQNLKPFKATGEAKMIFLSRYGRKKNFKWLIDNLTGISGNLHIDVYGPLEDRDYWDETVRLISDLPANIKVEYKGEVFYEEVHKIMFQYHFFVLPTLGENFGHVFIEALAVGCPLIISDRTPWRNLEAKQIGWDLALEKPFEWIEKLNQCINMDDVSYSKMSENAREFACQWLNDPEIESSTLNVLRYSLKI